MCFTGNIPPNEKIILRANPSAHVSTEKAVYELFHGGHGTGTRTSERATVPQTCLARDMVIANTNVQKRESHLIAGGRQKSQMDLFLARSDQSPIINCTVIPGKCIVNQHRLFLMDFRMQRPWNHQNLWALERPKGWKL